MKITKKQFQFFIKECEYWLQKLKIDDVRVSYYFEEPKMDGDASCTQSYQHKIAEIMLHPNLYPHDNETIQQMIKRLAKHEVMHILIGEMLILSLSRFGDEEEIRAANHRIVRKLEKIIN